MPFIRASLVAFASATLAVPLAAQTVSIDLPAQEAAAAIRQFARQANVQILIAGADARGRRTNAVRGSMDVAEALEQMLAGTGLAARPTGPQAWVVVPEGGARSTAGMPFASLGGAGIGSADPIAADEILVTAQRRLERLQEVPISISVVGARTLDQLRLNDFEDVSRLVPNLLVSSFSPGRPILAIRGATNTFNQIGVDKPVGVVVDDVIISRNSAQTFELFGLESVQVLRGPQGTLFGRNVTGGVIVVDTGRPAFGESQARIRSFVGEHDTVEFDALADLAAGPGRALRVAALVRASDGWGRDRLTGQRLDDQESYGARATFRTQLSEAAELLLQADVSHDETGGRTLSSIQAGDDGNPRTAEAGVPQGFDRTQYGFSARLFVDTRLGELASITALRHSRTEDRFANVAANFRFLTGTQSQLLSDDRDNVTTVTQELRLASPQYRWGNFLVGTFLLHEVAKRTLESTALRATSGALVTNILTEGRVRSRSAAVFAEATVTLLPAVSATLGGRYTFDAKTASINRTDRINPAGSFAVLGLERSWDEFTPRAVLRLQPTPDLLAYASYARGYTAGGFNTEAASPAAFRQPFEPERVESFEAGVKTQWLDRALTLNAALFHMNYRDKQELFFNNVTRILNIVNAARATVRGAEVELSARPAPWLSISANYGHLDTRYDDFVIPGGANNTGNPLGSSPRHQVAIIGDISRPVGQGRAFMTVSYAYTSSYFTGASRDPNLFIEGYDLVNATIGYAAANDRFQVSAFARNLFDTDYVLIPSIQVVRARYLGAPRVAGIAVNMRF